MHPKPCTHTRLVRILESMRNRQSKEMPGSNHYDYEYREKGVLT